MVFSVTIVALVLYLTLFCGAVLDTLTALKPDSPQQSATGCCSELSGSAALYGVVRRGRGRHGVVQYDAVV